MQTECLSPDQFHSAAIPDLLVREQPDDEEEDEEEDEGDDRDDNDDQEESDDGYSE
jgi:hypothetical protein